jgi:glucokinase
MTPDRQPFLVADVGGTWARFALVGEGPRDLRHIERFRCLDFPSLEAALGAYLARACPAGIRAACLALPGPVEGDWVHMANNPWRISRSALEAFLRAPVALVNDFAAQAMASSTVLPDELHYIGAPRPAEQGIRIVVGAGTGLGVAVRLPGGQVLPSEAGHVGFSPATPHERELLNALLGQHARVSVERLVSGPGLVNLYHANQVVAGHSSPGTPDPMTPGLVRSLAQEGDPIAQQAVRDFFNALASFAADLALVLLATGGVYLSGGVVPKLLGLLDADAFRRRFEAKGRLQGFAATVATACMGLDEPGLVGAAVHLDPRG